MSRHLVQRRIYLDVINNMLQLKVQTLPDLNHKIIAFNVLSC